MYSDSPIPNVDIDNDVFALDSTTVSLSLKLFVWAEGKYSRGAIKIHTMLNLRGSIPTFIFITDGKYHDSNILDEIVPQPDAIYLPDKAYIDFASLYRMDKAEPYHKSALGSFRKCGKSPRLDRYLYLSHSRSSKICS